MGNYNEYGYDEGMYTLTIPEEARDKWSAWKKETRANYSEETAQTIVDCCDTTLFLGGKSNETNREINEIKNSIVSSRDYVVDVVNTRSNEIKSKIDSSRTVIDNIWNAVKNF